MHQDRLTLVSQVNINIMMVININININIMMIFVSQVNINIIIRITDHAIVKQIAYKFALSLKQNLILNSPQFFLELSFYFLVPGYYPVVKWTKIEENTHSLQASSDYMALPYRILTLLANHYLMSFGRLSSAAIENIAWFCS